MSVWFCGVSYSQLAIDQEIIPKELRGRRVIIVSRLFLLLSSTWRPCMRQHITNTHSKHLIHFFLIQIVFFGSGLGCGRQSVISQTSSGVQAASRGQQSSTFLKRIVFFYSVDTRRHHSAHTLDYSLVHITVKVLTIIVIEKN